MKYPKDAKRIKEVCDYLHITSYTLAKNLGYKSPSSIYHVEQGTNQITTKMAHKIIDIYPQFNFIYLIGGYNKAKGASNELLIPENLIGKQQTFSTVRGGNHMGSNEEDSSLKDDVKELQQQLKVMQKDMEKVLQILLKNEL
jgi:hypothetical protein